MKKHFFIALAVVSLMAFGHQDEVSGQRTTSTDISSNETVVASSTDSISRFGELIVPEGAISNSEILELTKKGEDSIEVKFESEIYEVCQKKGCWMTVAFGDKDMMVRFKDYGFFVPLDAAGKTAIMNGIAFRDTVSVEDLQHYAQDAGKDEEYITSITQPEVSWAFEANGVIIKE